MTVTEESATTRRGEQRAPPLRVMGPKHADQENVLLEWGTGEVSLGSVPLVSAFVAHPHNDDDVNRVRNVETSVQTSVGNARQSVCGCFASAMHRLLIEGKGLEDEGEEEEDYAGALHECFHGDGQCDGHMLPAWVAADPHALVAKNLGGEEMAFVVSVVGWQVNFALVDAARGITVEISVGQIFAPAADFKDKFMSILDNVAREIDDDDNDDNLIREVNLEIRPYAGWGLLISLCEYNEADEIVDVVANIILSAQMCREIYAKFAIE